MASHWGPHWHDYHWLDEQWLTSEEDADSGCVFAECERLAVDQEQGGSEYPFNEPSDDVRQVILDFYLAFEDRYSLFTLPFSLDWLYGFGEDVVAAPGGTPTPTHTLDLRVKDADGNTVFDSTTADDFFQKDWGTNEIVEWRSDDAVCRVVRCGQC